MIENSVDRTENMQGMNHARDCFHEHLVVAVLSVIRRRRLIAAFLLYKSSQDVHSGSITYSTTSSSRSMMWFCQEDGRKGANMVFYLRRPRDFFGHPESSSYALLSDVRTLFQLLQYALLCLSKIRALSKVPSNANHMS